METVDKTINTQRESLIPIDLIYNVVSFSDLPSLLSMRQTCKIINKYISTFKMLTLEQTKTWINDHQQLEGKFKILAKIMPNLNLVYIHIELNASKIEHMSKYGKARTKTRVLAREKYIDKHFGFLSEIKTRVICTMDFIPDGMKLATSDVITKLFLGMYTPGKFELRKIRLFVKPGKSIGNFSDANSIFTICKVKGDVLTIPDPSFIPNSRFAKPYRPFKIVKVIKIKRTPLYYSGGCCFFEGLKGAKTQCPNNSLLYSYFCKEHLTREIPSRVKFNINVKIISVPKGIVLTTSKNANVYYI